MISGALGTGTARGGGDKEVGREVTAGEGTRTCRGVMSISCPRIMWFWFGRVGHNVCRIWVFGIVLCRTQDVFVDVIVIAL